MKRFLVLVGAAATAVLSLVSSGLSASSTVSPHRAGSLLASIGEPMTGVSDGGLPIISENWSGYAVTSPRQFSHVEASFVQPAVKCSGKSDRWSSNWVGLDGFRDSTVEQVGTAAFCSGKTNLTPVYLAFWEMFPAASVIVFQVKPGDTIDASVGFTDGKFELRISDVTEGQTALKAVGCARCRRASAEWIVERPALCNNRGKHCILAALANFATTEMQDATAATTGPAEGITSYSSFHSIYMIQPLKRGFISLDSVSAVNPSAPSFEVRYERSGWTIPTHLRPMS